MRRGTAATARTRRTPRRAVRSIGLRRARRASAVDASSGSGSSTVSGGPRGREADVGHEHGPMLRVGAATPRAELRASAHRDVGAEATGIDGQMPETDDGNRARGDAGTAEAADAARARAPRGHGAHRSAALRVACPASTCPRRASARPKRPPNGSRCCRSPRSTRARSSGRPQTAQCIATHHALEVLPLPGVIEADYGEWTGGKIADLAKTDEWKVVQVAPSRARFPGGESIREMQARMVAALDAVVADASARDRRRRESRRSDQVGDRALHRHAPRPVPACARVARRRPRCFDFHAYGVHAREVQRHRRPRRPASRTERRRAT